MSKQKNPNWFWFALIPYIGGLGVIYAGKKIRHFFWVYAGLFTTTLGLILASSYSHLFGFVWLTQVAIAFILKDEYQEAISKTPKLPDNQPTATNLLPKSSQSGDRKIDINSCSKDDLVYGLNLPIVYANEIESARFEGHIFTHVEELLEIAGIPDTYLAQLEERVIYSYDINKEAQSSWRKCNSYSEQELIDCNLEPAVAAKIIKERSLKGAFNSFPNLRKRTGLPLDKLKALL